jgi:hypothetical protein
MVSVSWGEYGECGGEKGESVGEKSVKSTFYYCSPPSITAVPRLYL